MGLIKNLHTRNMFVFSPLKEHYITEIGSSEPPKKRIQVFLPSRVIAPLMGAARVGWLYLVVPRCHHAAAAHCTSSLFNEPPPLRRCQQPTIFSAHLISGYKSRKWSKLLNSSSESVHRIPYQVQVDEIDWKERVYSNVLPNWCVFYFVLVVICSTKNWLFGCWRSIGLDQICLKRIYPRGFHWQTLKRTRHACSRKWSAGYTLFTYEIRVRVSHKHSHFTRSKNADARWCGNCLPPQWGKKYVGIPLSRQLHKTGSTIIERL